MSNILKGFYTKQTEERVIDYNEVISGKIESFKKRIEKEKIEADGFVNGLEASVVEGLIGEEFQPGIQVAATLDEATLGELISERNAEQPAVDMEAVNNMADEIVADANAKAEEILENARKEAEVVKNTAYSQALEDGRKEGYNKGVAKADMEYQARFEELKEKEIQLEQEYAKKHSVMEQEIVSTLLEVFERVTHTIAEDNKEIVLHLIDNVMNNVEFSRDFFIRVSKEDYPFLVQNQGKLYGAASKDININVMEDTSLVKNQCIIETDGGVFDCSLDIQLEQLIKDIKLLSCI